MQKVIDNQIVKWEEAGMTEEQIEQVLSFSKKIFQPGMVSFMSLFFGLFTGVIIGLIISAIQKKTANQ